MSDSPHERAAAYRLLSTCFQPPDDLLLATIRETGPEWTDPGAVPPLPELQRDYARLFVGPFTVLAPPYGSVYLENDRRVCGVSTIDILARYREEGLELTLREPADHGAIELEYMYVLVFRQAEAATGGDARTAERYLDKQHDFLARHLGVWMPRWKDRIVEHARTTFYPQLAEAADSLTCRDLTTCNNRLRSGLPGSGGQGAAPSLVVSGSGQLPRPDRRCTID